MHIRGGLVLALAVLLGAVAFAAACGDDEELRPSTIATPTLEELPQGESTEPADDPDGEDADDTPTPTPDPTEEPSPSPTPEEDEDETSSDGGAQALLSAASAELGVPAGDACGDEDDCVEQLPDGTDPSGDIARLAYVSASGGGAIIVMARDAAGDWGVWMLTQSPYQLLQLPGQLMACARPTVIRDEPAPGAAALGEVERLEALQSTGFVLAERGSLSGAGAGWYRVSSPIEGWVYSRDVTRTSDDSCALRDAAEGEPNPRG